LQSGPRPDKAAGSVYFLEVPMSAILMILAFVVVMFGLNIFEFGRPD
jgi:ribose/xylose/arabinose/galactoside ABC-type transport system permease subunit